jgi:hypothetical protein
VRGAEAHLFRNRHATQWLSIQPQNAGGEIAFIGENPSRNATIGYYLSDRVKGNVRFEVSDVTGANTCTLEVPAESGIGRLEWRLLCNPAGAGPQPLVGRAGGGGGVVGGGGGGRGGRGGGGGGGACLIAVNAQAQGGGGGGRGGGGGGGGRGGGGGGLVQPGTYRVTMVANGRSYASAIEVRADPMLAEIR